MSEKKPGSGADVASAFRSALSDVRPLEDRVERVPPAPPRRGGPQSDPPPAPPFSVEHQGERVTGLAQGIDGRHLQRLLRGELEIEARVDLHGLDSERARDALQKLFARARGDAARCLLVVHGRGLRSDGAPVLREAALEWLTAPPQAARVMAFASALPRDGGSGALYVLLRRDR